MPRNLSYTIINEVVVYTLIEKHNKKRTYSCWCPVCKKKSWVYQEDLMNGRGCCSVCASKMRSLYKKEKKNNKNNGTIYGIYYKNELIYIGMTMRNAEKRFQEHLENAKNLQNDYQGRHLYKFMSENIKDITFNIIEKLENTTLFETQAKEKEYIENFQPRFNYDGVKRDYTFSNGLSEAQHKFFIENKEEFRNLHKKRDYKKFDKK